jgi:hypothetical protein
MSTFAFWWHARRFSSRAALQTEEKSRGTVSALRAAAAVSRTAVYCALFVVFSIIFRTIFAIPFAVASYADRGDAKCPIMCSSCQKTWFLIYQWLANLPWMRATFLIVRSVALTCTTRRVTHRYCFTRYLPLFQRADGGGGCHMG